MTKKLPKTFKFKPKKELKYLFTKYNIILILTSI